MPYWDLQRPNAPRNISGEVNSGGSISLSWDESDYALSYVVEYGLINKNESLKKVYTENKVWELSVDNMPDFEIGDIILFSVRSYDRLGNGETDQDKISDLIQNAVASKTTADYSYLFDMALIFPSVYTIGASNITGKYIGPITKGKIFVDGIEKTFGGNFSNRVFSYYAKGAGIKPDSIVSISGYDSNGNIITKQINIEMTES